MAGESMVGGGSEGMCIEWSANSLARFSPVHFGAIERSVEPLFGRHRSLLQYVEHAKIAVSGHTWSVFELFGTALDLMKT